MSAPRVCPVPLGKDRLGHAPVGRDVGVVPSDAELVGRVVVAVDQVRDREVRQAGKAVRYSGRDEDAECVVGVEVHREGGRVGRRALPHVMQDDTRPASGHGPVIRLVEVVVQPDHRPCLALGPVTLDHLTAQGNQLRRYVSIKTPLSSP